jgi:hypothetical protein
MNLHSDRESPDVREKMAVLFQQTSFGMKPAAVAAGSV